MTRIASVVLSILLLFAVFLIPGCGGGSGPGTSTLVNGQIKGIVDRSNIDSSKPVTIALDEMETSAQLDADGYFTIDEVPAGIHTVTLLNGNRYETSVALVENSATTMLSRLYMHDDVCRISGRVTSSSDEPIDGVTVTITGYSQGNATSTPPSFLRQTHTDSDGNYSFSGLPGGDHIIVFTKSGYNAFALVQLSDNMPNTPRNAVMTSVSTGNTGSVSGSVSVDGFRKQPHSWAGFMIRLTPVSVPVPTNPLPSLCLTMEGKEVGTNTGEYYTFTTQDSSYQINGIPAGRYNIVAVRPGFDQVQKTVDITAGDSKRIDFAPKLHTVAACIVEGIVTDASTGKPVANVDVRAWWAAVSKAVGYSSKDFCYLSKTDTAGHYRLVLPINFGDDTEISGYIDGYKYFVKSIDPAARSHFDVNMALQKVTVTSAKLSGHIDMPGTNGKIAAVGAKVTIRQNVSTRSAGPWEATTDANGDYSITLAPGHYWVSVRKDSYMGKPLDLYLSEDTNHDFSLALREE